MTTSLSFQALSGGLIKWPLGWAIRTMLLIELGWPIHHFNFCSYLPSPPPISHTSPRSPPAYHKFLEKSKTNKTHRKSEVDTLRKSRRHTRNHDIHEHFEIISSLSSYGHGENRSLRQDMDLCIESWAPLCIPRLHCNGMEGHSRFLFSF